MLTRLHEQASLQLAARESGENSYELRAPQEGRGFARMPRPSEGDVFFDMEGDPLFDDGGLEYLFGFVTADGEEPEFTAIWGRDRAEEKRALEEFVDFVTERRKEFPDLHIYHYNHYEVTALKRIAGAHGTREEELDQLLRDEVFVDLYKVVREAMLISQPSYSIKKVEAFYMDQRDTAVTDGGDSVVMFERWLEEDDAKILEEIADYNRDDCISTLKLRDWLLELRAEAERQFDGRDEAQWIRWFEPEPTERSEKALALQEENEALIESLLAGLPEDPADWDPDQQARFRMAQLLEYHHREARPVWWALFDRMEATADALKEDADCISMLAHDGSVPPRQEKKSLVERLTFPPQETKMGAGSDAVDPTDGGNPGAIVAMDVEQGWLELKRGPKLQQREFPAALIPGRPYSTPEQQGALRRLAATVIDAPGTPDAADRYAAARRLLRGDPPRLSDREPGADIDHAEMEIDELKEIVASLDGSHLFIQGPPGSGKTYTGARLIVDLIERGQRVGVTSTSHKVIHNLLDEIEDVAHEQGVEFKGLKKSSDNPDSVFDSEHGLIDSVDDNAALSDPAARLTAGTAWHYCREDTEPLDYLFIDEAGQVSLADALALATSAHNVVLLGDPQQLPQVAQASHPEGSSLSVLEHLLGESQTVDSAHGVFLEKTYRLHPDVCEFVSELMYDGRLQLCAGPRAPARRRRRRSRRHGLALAAGGARGPRPVLAGGGRPHRRGDRAASLRLHLHRLRRRRASAAARGHPRPRPLQRPGPVPAGAPSRRGPRRHRRQVPGPAGAGRLLLDGDLQRRGDSPKRRVPLQPQPPQRRDLTRSVPRGPRLQPASARHPRDLDRADAAGQRAVQIRRGCPQQRERNLGVGRRGRSAPCEGSYRR